MYYQYELAHYKGNMGHDATSDAALALPPSPPGGPPPTRPGQEDTRHPKNKLLMDPYLKRYNNYVNIPEILTASGRRMPDLPTLPKYCHPTGQSFLCYGPSSNEEVPHPLMDYGQGKINNIVNNDPATGRSSDKVGGDIASGQEDGRVGSRASNGEEDATWNGNANEDVPIAIAGVNYPIAWAPHPINKSGRLRKCELIPPPHSATPPPGVQRTVKWKSVSQPPSNGATPPLGGSNKSGRLCKCESIPPPHGAIPPLSGPMTVNRKWISQPPPHGAVVPQPTKSLEGLPLILYQTGGLLTGAETDKLRLQNRRRRHTLQDQQVPTTLWSTHMGQASLLPRQERPLEYHNEMCPAGIATSHPAGELLSEWSQLGCPTKAGRPWSKEEMWEAVA
jgi:hypothetical protein